MPRITCPTCGAALDVTPDMVGETVECGSCQAHFVAQERKPPARRTVADEDRPSRRRRDEEDEDRPSRRRRDEDDYEDEYDDRPRRRRRRTEAVNGMAMTAMIMGIGSVVLALFSFICCIGYVSGPVAVLAIIFGIIGMKPGSKGYALTGIITGGVALLMMILAVVLVGAILAFTPRNNPPPNNPPPWNQPRPPPPPQPPVRR
jgi:hypothetical protein